MTPTKEPESTPTLTAGFTLSVLSGASKDETSLEAGSHVRLQVVALKTLTDATGSERYRTAMSDGVYVLNCNVGVWPPLFLNPLSKQAWSPPPPTASLPPTRSSRARSCR